jgi:hypothetical protein
VRRVESAAYVVSKEQPACFSCANRQTDPSCLAHQDTAIQEVNLDLVWLAQVIKAKCGDGLVAIMCNDERTHIATSKKKLARDSHRNA